MIVAQMPSKSSSETDIVTIAAFVASLW